MANNNETTTSFKVDIAELKANFQEAQRQIRLANSEFKAATAGMDDWSKSADGVSAKLTQLNKNLESEKTKLKSLEEQYKLVVKEQGENSKGAQELAIKINNQKAVVGNTEKQIRTYTAQLDAMETESGEATKASDKLDNSLQKTKDTSAKTGEGFTVLKGVLTNLVTAGIQIAIKAFKDLTAAAKDAYDEYDKGRDNLIKATGATGDAAQEISKIYSDTAKQVRGDMGDIGLAIGEVSTRFGLNGKELEDLSIQYMKFSDITGEDVVQAVDNSQKAMSAYGVEVQDAGKFLDILAKTAQDTGVSTSKLTTGIVSNATAFQEMGLTVDQAVVFMGQLEKSGANSETVLNGMRKALKNSATDGLNLNDSLMQLQESIENGTNGVDGLKAAYDLFGKSGDQIYGAIKTGSLSFEDLAKSAINAEGTVSKTYEETQSGADKVALAMQSIKVTVGEVTSGLVEEFAPQIQEFLGLLEKTITGDKDAMSSLSDIVSELVEKVSDKLSDALPQLNSLIITAIGSFATTISKNLPVIIQSTIDASNQIIDTIIKIVPTLVSGLVNSIPKLIAGITQIVSKVVTSLGKLIPKIVNQVILVVPKIIDSLLAAAPELLNAAIIFLTEIVKAIPTVVTHIAQALPQIINTIVNSLNSFVPQLIEGTIMLLNAIVEAIPLILPPLIEALPQIIAGIVQIFTDSIPILTEATIMLFMAMIQAIPTIIEQLMPQIPMIIAAVIDALIANAPLLLEAAVTVFMEIANAIPMILQALWDGLTTVFRAVVDDLLAAFVENWLAGWEILKEHFAPVMTFFQNLITKVKNTAEKAIKNVRDKLDAAWRAIKKVWETVANFFVGVWNGIKNAFKTADTWFTTIFTNAWNGVKNVWDKVAGFFTNMWKTIRNYFSGDGNYEQGVSGFFTTSFTKAWNGIKGIWDKVTKYFSDIWDNIVNTFTPVKDWISEQFNKAWDAISEVWDKVSKYFSDIWDNIIEVFTPVKAWVSEQFTKAWDNISKVWDKVSKYFSDIWDNIVETFKGAKDWLSEQFTKAWNAISEVWNGVSDYFEKAKSHILGAFSGDGEDSLIGGIRKKFLDAWQAVKNIFSSDNISYFFEGVINTITGLFSGLGDIVGNSVSESLKGAVNAMLDSAEWALNLLPGMFNKALQTITDISGKSFSLFGTVSLPRLAKGGVVTQSTLANIGEAGAEAIVPLENNTQWLDEIAKRLATSMKTAGIAINAAQQPNVVNNNFYQTNNSPKALSRLEIYRQSKNLLQLRGGY